MHYRFHQNVLILVKDALHGDMYAVTFLFCRRHAPSDDLIPGHTKYATSGCWLRRQTKPFSLAWMTRNFLILHIMRHKCKVFAVEKSWWNFVSHKFVLAAWKLWCRDAILGDKDRLLAGHSWPDYHPAASADLVRGPKANKFTLTHHPMPCTCLIETTNKL